MQVEVSGELRAVVERDGAPERLRQRAEQLRDEVGDRTGGLSLRHGGEQQSRGTLVHGEDRLPVFREQHEVGFPVAGRGAVSGLCGALADRDTAGHQQRGTATPAAAPAPFALSPRQVVAPAVILVAGDLGVDEAVDALDADDAAAVSALERRAGLLRRPAASERFQHLRTQGAVPLQPGPAPAPRLALVGRPGRGVPRLLATVALQLPSNRRWRAIQICSDLPDRASFGTKDGNPAAFFKRKLVIPLAHGNTVAWCCTSFENSGDPAQRTGLPLARE